MLLFKFDEAKGLANGIEYLKRRELIAVLRPGAKEHFLENGISLKDLWDGCFSVRCSA